jgi:hypothetical protein
MLCLLFAVWLPRANASVSLPNGDQLWVLSSRGLTSTAACADLEAPRLRAYCFDGRCHFTPCELAQLLALMREDPMPTVIYAHGNRFDASEAIERGWFVYRQLARYRCGRDPIRFVIWSWPSDRIKGILKDVRIKAERTDAQGLYLGWVLKRVPAPAHPLTLIGYSFGGRVVTGALHAAAGGALAGRALPGPPVEGLRVRVGLVAAAVNRDWLHPGYYHGLATRNMHKLELMYNPRDSILRRYWLLEPDSGAEALGATGPVRVGPRVDGTPLPVCAHDCSQAVGIEHDEMDYYSRDCRAGAVLSKLIDCP